MLAIIELSLKSKLYFFKTSMFWILSPSLSIPIFDKKDLRIKDVMLKSVRGFPNSDKPFGINFTNNNNEPQSLIVLGGNASGKSSIYDAIEYSYFTTTKGLFDKIRQYKGDSDFDVLPSVVECLRRKDFGRYAAGDGNMNVCFISDNDITGGNSGSGMFNGKGELIGLAFDGNWEAMSGDIVFEPNLQRCIGVDIRYVLYMIEKYGKASCLIDELKLKD